MWLDDVVKKAKKAIKPKHVKEREKEEQGMV